MSAITLPGDIPGLIRKGSPVVATIGNLPDQRGVYVMRDTDRADRACVVVEDLPGYGQIIAWPLIAGTALDLTDATGRAHAAWWLALSDVPATHRLDPAAVSWSRAPGGPSCGWAMHWLARAIGNDGSLTGAWWTGTRTPRPKYAAALSALDPDDPRLLPDGSRWVDAEALRLVVLHVAGRAP